MQLHDTLLLCPPAILLEAISHNSNALIQSDIQITPSGQRFVKADAADHNHRCLLYTSETTVFRHFTHFFYFRRIFLLPFYLLPAFLTDFL